MSNMNDLVYNPVTGMFEKSADEVQINPNSNNQPEWNPSLDRPQSRITPVSAPIINTFQRRGEPMLGKKCKFVWNVSGATLLHITGLGELPMCNTGACKLDITAAYMEVTLSATNAIGTTSRTLKVYPGGLEALPLPIINSFTKLGNGQKVGDEFVLRWDVQGASRVFLEGEYSMAVQHEGTSHVKIEQQPRTYKLKAYNSVGGEVVEAIEVAACQPCINSFASSLVDGLARIGDDIVLTWNTHSCDGVALMCNSIECGAERLATCGSLSVKIEDENPTFTLVAYNAGVTNSESLSIKTQSLGKPTIDKISFEALSEPLFVGDKVLLKWKTSETTAVQIFNGDSLLCTEATIGSKEIVVTDTNMTLNVAAKNNKCFITEKIEIKALALPVIEEFKASTAICKLGDRVELSWTTTNAEKITIGNQDLEPNGSVPIVMSNTINRIPLRAYSGSKWVEKVVEIKAQNDPRPIIRSFRFPLDADRSKGRSIMLYWEVDNADKVELVFGGKKTERHPLSGSRSFKIMRDKIVVKLIATNGTYKAERELVIEMEKTFFQKLFG